LTAVRQITAGACLERDLAIAVNPAGAGGIEGEPAQSAEAQDRDHVARLCEAYRALDRCSPVEHDLNASAAPGGSASSELGQAGDASGVRSAAGGQDKTIAQGTRPASALVSLVGLAEPDGAKDGR
jgi:hypothetical protein